MEILCVIWASQVALVVKNLPANAGDIKRGGLIPGPGRSPEEGHGNPLQYSCLENPMDRGAWEATVHGITKSRIQRKWLSTHMCTLHSIRSWFTFTWRYKWMRLFQSCQSHECSFFNLMRSSDHISQHSFSSVSLHSMFIYSVWCGIAGFTLDHLFTYVNNLLKYISKCSFGFSYHSSW